MLGPLRYCTHLKLMNHASLAFNSNTLGQVIINLASRAHYSDEPNPCKPPCPPCPCKDVAQTAGKRVEAWPKSDPPPAPWRAECPSEPQPPNYDPYRIKVPDVVVPPLPPSNAKEIANEDARELFKGPEFNFHSSSSVQDLFHNSPIVHPDYWKDKPVKKLTEVVKEVLPKLGYHGKNKYKYAFHEPWRPLDRMALLEQAEKQELEQLDELAVVKSESTSTFNKKDQVQKQKNIENEDKPMIDCTKVKGPCSLTKTMQDRPPIPPPPPPHPFNWMYLLALLSVFGAFGLMYKLYLWFDQKKKLDESRNVWRPRRKIKRPYNERDLPACVQYLIIGAGAAGWAAYRAIMEHDKTAKVFFITKEDMIPYQRPPMSKHMWFNEEPPDVRTLRYVEDMKRKTMFNAECINFLDPIMFYRKKHGPALSIATGWCVLRLDADDHVAYVKTMSGEKAIYYERCLLAPGSVAKNMDVFKSAPKNVRAKVCRLRTVRDLENAYRKVKSAKSVVIIGGGCLGCELAWYLGRMNKTIPRDDDKPLELVHVFKDKGILSGILPEYLGEWAAELIKCEGVTLIPKAQVYDAFESPDGRLELTLSNGESIVTDYAFLCIGADPRVDLAEPSFLEVDPINGGFLVNTELEARTHLYIAGDAASYYAQWKDTRMRSEHYINAEEQGYIAGANMTGYWIPCNMEPNYFVRLGEHLQMEVVGEVGACMPIVGLFKECNDEDSEQEAIEMAGGAGDKRKCYKEHSVEYQNRYKRGLLFYMREETVVGFVFWNMPPIDDRKEVATELLRAKPSYNDISILAELLGFPETRCTYKKAVKEAEKEVCITNWKVW